METGQTDPHKQDQVDQVEPQVPVLIVQEPSRPQARAGLEVRVKTEVTRQVVREAQEVLEARAGLSLTA